MKRVTGAFASLAVASGALLFVPSAAQADTLPPLPVKFTAPAGPFYVGKEIAVDPAAVTASLPAWEKYYGIEIWDKDPNALGDWDGDGDVEPYYDYTVAHIPGDSDNGHEFGQPSTFNVAQNPWGAPRPGSALRYTPTSADLGKYVVLYGSASERAPYSWDEDAQGAYAYHYSAWYFGPTLQATQLYDWDGDAATPDTIQADPTGSPYQVIGTVAPTLLALPSADTKAIAKVKGKTNAKVGATVAVVAPKKFGVAKVKVSYKWFANGVAIPKAKKSSLKLAKKYKGKKLTVVITVGKSGFSAYTKTVSFGKIKK